MKVCFLPFAALLLLLSVAATAQTCNERVSPSAPDSRFSVSGDEATDLQTGLIWQRCSIGQSWDASGCSGSATTHTWSDALSLATDGWRLPNIKELTSIVETACYEPSINLMVFPNTPSNQYWSSSSSAYYSNSAGFVYFGIGSVAPHDKSVARSVRLVRDVQ